MKPKLIACDIDGTLLMAGESDLSHETEGLIGQALDEGIVFAPASGRQYTGLKKLFARLDGARLGRTQSGPSQHEPARLDGAICYVAENGSIAYVGDELVHRMALPRDLGLEIARTMLERPECELYVAGVETCYVKPKDPAYVEHLRNDLHFDVTIVDDVAAIDEPFLKVSAYHKAFNPDLEFWQRKFGDCSNVVLSSPDWIDISPTGANKGAGVKAICERLGIDPADCVAFGDADNDVAMFDLVGHPIAMQHASAMAKAHAQATTSNVNDALARILNG